MNYQCRHGVISDSNGETSCGDCLEERKHLFANLKPQMMGLPFFVHDPITDYVPNEVIEKIKGSHWVNLQIRINGETQTIEADWLKTYILNH